MERTHLLTFHNILGCEQPPLLDSLNVKVSRISVEVYRLTWNHVLPDGQPYNITICLRSWNDKKWTESDKYEMISSLFRFNVLKGYWYKITVVAGALKQTVSFRAEFSVEDLQRLYGKAVKYNRKKVETVPKFKQIDKLYRTKFLKYFQDTRRKDRGVMRKYMKDNNGDPACPINGAIEGLFFATSTLSNGKLPGFSNFGNTRLVAPASFFVSSDAFNGPVAAKRGRPKIYFSDFYCMKTQHWVTIVLTYDGTDTDSFCSKKLLQLGLKDNDFFRIDDDLNVSITKSKKIFVEVFYTEDINMKHWQQNGCEIVHVKARGKGSKPDGVAKQRSCKICNL